MRFKLIITFALALFIGRSHTPSIIFKENKGQWPEKVLFGAEYMNARYFLTKTGFRFCVYGSSGSHTHENNTDRLTAAASVIKNTLGHVYEVDFSGASYKSCEKEGEQPEYYNYFLGNDKKHWAGNVKAWARISYKDFYPQTDLIAYCSENNFKYDLELKPGADPAKVKMKYKYISELKIKNKKLVITTTVGEITEYEPYAYQIKNGKKTEVKCKYILLENNVVGFEFPEGYDTKTKLVIDPTVIVCSYSRSTVWSNCIGAGYDDLGNIYVLGYSHTGYPTDTAGFQDSCMPGAMNIIISKYDPTGSTRFFSTFLGGNGIEVPQNIIVNKRGIYLYSQTTSTNFPVTPDAFDTTYNGGVADLTMSRFNLQCTQLLNSTYIGGNFYDGTNDVTNGLSPYYNNDGSMIGHFVMDDNGNSYCVSASTSTNFPTTAGAYQSTKKGFSDAVVFKLDSTLSNLLWSTYVGGTNSENGMGIRHDGNGGAYIDGSTYSTNFPTTPGVISPTDMVNVDMYISHVNNKGTGLIASTYLGTPGGDWGYFLDTDQNNDLYLCGYINSAPTLTPTPGVYSSALGKNTIYKVNSSLTNLIYKTKYGTQILSVGNIVPSAFNVDSCQNIYISGTVSNSYMPVSSNAIQSKVNGKSDQYYAVFRNNMSSLGYGTYFGGSREEHVDGGISAFTKRGVLYQGICIQGRLPVTPNAYGQVDYTTIDTNWCNDAFIKFDMQTFVNAGSSYGAAITGCPPFTPTFVSTTNTGNTYWDLGNGVTSTLDTVSTTYTVLGNYNVLLIVTDTNTCNRYDSIKSILSVINPTPFDIGEDVVTCLNTRALVKSNIAALTYSWSTGETTPNIYALPGTYALTINNGGCNSSDEINVVVGEKKLAERFPNVVTPNSDGINDRIDLDKYNFDEMEFIVYDRWGKEQYRSTNHLDKWEPKDLKDGSYFYIINYTSSCTGKHHADKGFISIFK
jgi:gliding motility-associated-like protein